MENNQRKSFEERKASSYVTTPEMLQAVEHIYDHECSIEFIVDTIKGAYIKGAEESKAWINNYFSLTEAQKKSYEQKIE